MTSHQTNELCVVLQQIAITQALFRDAISRFERLAAEAGHAVTLIAGDDFTGYETGASRHSARLSAAATHWKQKILIWFVPPAKLAGPPPEVSAATVKKYDAHGTRSGQIYGAFTFVTALIGLFLFLTPFSWWNTGRHLAAACFLIWTLACCGAFLENKAWAKWAETARLTVFFAAALAALF
jgi:hypothetical protein